MKVLIACEFSGIVRDAFIKKGHDAWSCDLLPTEKPGNHIQDDVLKHLHKGWDMMIAHPPCTYLATSGNRCFKDNPERYYQMEIAVEFVKTLANAPIPKIAIENPVGRLSSRWRKPDQYVQPWQFGCGETKKTGLWLKGLQKLVPTNLVDGRVGRVWYTRPGVDRWKDRSRTYEGIANAMAAQWV